MADPFFDRPAATPDPRPVAATSGPSPLLGLAMLVMAGLLAFVIVSGGIPTPGPGPGPDPNPRPDVGDLSETAAIAGKLEDRLYADVFNQLADETEAGNFKTAEAWHAAAKQRLYDARFKAHEPVHTALNELLPSGNTGDAAAFAAAQREIAKGFQRSGK